MQQRSVSKEIVELLIAYGATRPVRDGCESLYFDRSSWRHAANELGGRAKALEKFRNTFAIVAPDGTIVTVARAH